MEKIDKVAEAYHSLRRTIRRLFYLVVIIFIAFFSGWVKIECNGNEIYRDLKKTAIALIEKAPHGVRPGSVSTGLQESRYPSASMRRYQIEIFNRMYDAKAHVVKQGEDLMDICRAYDLPPWIIQAANVKITDFRDLNPGQVVLIPILESGRIIKSQRSQTVRVAHR